jgi:3-hydroxypropanoate dehydrogenase
MGTPVDDAALDSIFRVARTQNKWLDKPVSNDQLLALYELMRWGPTSANCFPVRLVFVTSKVAKERLKPLVLEGNRQKVMTAPATAIIGYDTRFYEWLPRLFPHADARAWFVDKPEFAAATAFRNSSLQGAYFIIAARALGLDCGPMSGFDNEAVDRVFFPGGRIRSNFICAIGYGDPAGVFARLPRPEFSEVCSIV